MDPQPAGGHAHSHSHSGGHAHTHGVSGMHNSPGGGNGQSHDALSVSEYGANESRLVTVILLLFFVICLVVLF